MRAPSLTLLLALVAGAGAAANGFAAGDSEPRPKPAPSALGARIARDQASQQRETQRRQSNLDLKEKAVAAMAARIEQRTPPSPAPGEAGDTGDGDRYVQLARIYQAMKPARAAPVFEKLDLKVQVGVARKMRERAAAAIIQAMAPEPAARLSMALAGERPAPAKETSAKPVPTPKR